MLEDYLLRLIHLIRTGSEYRLVEYRGHITVKPRLEEAKVGIREASS